MESEKYVWLTLEKNELIDYCGIDAFVRMFNRIYENRQTFIKTMTANIEMIILLKPDIRETEALDKRIEELKNELKRLIRFQVNNNADSEVKQTPFLLKH